MNIEGRITYLENNLGARDTTDTTPKVQYAGDCMSRETLIKAAISAIELRISIEAITGVNEHRA